MKDLSRRDFFKKSAEKVLPILAGAFLMSVGIPSAYAATDCGYSCTGGCAGSCEGSCRGNCYDSCQNSCQGSCRNSCHGDCADVCRGY